MPRRCRRTSRSTDQSEPAATPRPGDRDAPWRCRLAALRPFAGRRPSRRRTSWQPANAGPTQGWCSPWRSVRRWTRPMCGVTSGGRSPSSPVSTPPNGLRGNCGTRSSRSCQMPAYPWRRSPASSATQGRPLPSWSTGTSSSRSSRRCHGYGSAVREQRLMSPLRQAQDIVQGTAGHRRCHSNSHSDQPNMGSESAFRLVKLVGLSGLEPLTSALSGQRSNRLSYRPE